MKKILTIIIGLLTACSSTTTVDIDPNMDLKNLPDTIDVHTASALQGRDDILLIDVREDWEYAEGHIPGITHIPMGEIEARLDEIPTDKTVILTCRSGNRSGQIYNFLSAQGFENVHNMAGGILAWQSAGYAVEP